MPLTDTAIRQAKPAAAPFKLSDGEGMFILVHPNGSKYWRMDYRINGKRKTLSLGVYPDVPLKLARTRRDEARAMLASGTDPAELRKAEKVTLSEAKQEEEETKELERMVQAGEALPGSFRGCPEFCVNGMGFNAEASCPRTGW
jgi:hypothetical protein